MVFFVDVIDIKSSVNFDEISLLRFKKFNENDQITLIFKKSKQI